MRRPLPTRQSPGARRHPAGGGDGALAGVFDGVDIDWEWPGTAQWAQHPGNGVDPANDRDNLTALLAELRRQLDALGAETGRDYLLSAFLPADKRWIASGWDIPGIFDSLDFGDIQGYDLYGF
jgi:chitinase